MNSTTMPMKNLDGDSIGIGCPKRQKCEGLLSKIKPNRMSYSLFQNLRNLGICDDMCNSDLLKAIKKRMQRSHENHSYFIYIDIVDLIVLLCLPCSPHHPIQ